MAENHGDDDQAQTHIPLLKDTMVGHYRITENISASGMGEVYLAEGKASVEVEVKYDSPTREAPATVTFTANGSQVGRGRIERSVPATFTASEIFDIGMDLGSPVSLDYHRRAPFAFNSKIHKIQIVYLGADEPEIPLSPDDD